MRSFAIALVVGAMAQLSLASSSPPACLLAAIGPQPNPADLKAVCGDEQKAVISGLTSACSGNSLPVAYSAYSATCSEQGITVSALPNLTAPSSSVASSISEPNPTSSTTSPASSAQHGSGSSTVTQTTTSAGSSPSPTGKNAADDTQPPRFLFALSALLATGIAGAVFL